MRSRAPGTTVNFHSYERILIIKLSPNQTLTDFITFTASLLGLWLGLSVIDFLSNFGHLIWKFCRIGTDFGRNLIKLFVLCSLLSICYVQIHLLISGYTEYGTTSNVNIGEPYSYNLPTLSILDTGAKYVSLRGEDFNLSPKLFHERHIGSLRNNRTILIWNTNSSGYDIYDQEILNNVLTISHSDASRIFTFELNKFNASNYTYDSHLKLPYIRIIFNDRPENFAKSIFMHYDSSYFYSIPLISTGVFYNWVSIKPTIQETKLLPAPYSSNCFEFDSVSPFIDCIKNTHYRVYSKHPYILRIPISSNISRMEPDWNILESCTNQTGHISKCLTTLYKLKHLTKYDMYQDKHSLDIEPIQEKLSCIFMPKTFLYDLLILISDALVLWLGISLGLIMRKFSNLCNGRKIKDFLVDYSETTD